MVRVIVVMLLVAFPLVGEVEVTVQIDAVRATAQRPVEVFVTITRDGKEAVDSNSFTLDGTPIIAQFLGDSTQQSLTVINNVRTERVVTSSQYRFQIPGQEPGLYVLPPVSVVVDGIEYESSAVSYEITQGELNDDFRLEAGLDRGTTLYVGQRVRLFYRIYFKDNIELTAEHLPLLEVSGLETIGDKTVVPGVISDYKVHEVSQWARAVTPGVFSFEAGMIEGYTYDVDFFGRRQYRKPRVRAESEPVTIVVKAFPEQGRSPLFNGAVGRFEIRANRIGSGPVVVGDKVEIAVEVVGEGDLEEVRLADLKEMPGFSKHFRLSDLPPRTELEDNVKRFFVDLRPTDASTTQIPPVVFAYFDPQSEQYKSVTTQPIPLSVEEGSLVPVVDQEDRPIPRVDDPKIEGGEIEIAGPMSIQHSAESFFFWRGWRSLWLLPITALLLALQWWLRRFLLRRERKEISESRVLLNRVINGEIEASKLYGVVQRALMLRLVELGKLDSTAVSIDDLSAEGSIGLVRAFLLKHATQRYSGGEHDPQEMVQQATQLYGELQ